MPRPQKSPVVDLQDLIWREFNRTKKAMTSRFSNGTDLVIEPGDRIIIPKQLEFLKSMYQYDAVLYGGAAGSGKTYILIWALVLILIKLAKDFEKRGIKQIPRVVLFSSTYQMLEDRHVKEIPNYLPDWFGKMYSSKPPEYHLCEELGSGQLLFRNLQDPSAYKSVQFAAIAFDEITENEEWVFNEIMIRKRFSYVDHIPVLAATNPTGVGRSWVHEKFVGKDAIKAKYIEEFDHWTKGYHYIQALPTDNPTLSKEYYAELHQKPPHLRDAYLYGSWDAFSGQIYHLKPEVHRFSRHMHIPDEWPRYRGIDKGVGHPTVCLWAAADFDGNLWIYREYSITGENALYHKPRIAKLSGIEFEGVDDVQVKGRVPDREEIYAATVGDPEMWRSAHTGMEDITWREVFNDDKDDWGSFDMIKAKITDVNEGLDDLHLGFSWEETWKDDENSVARRIITRPPRIRISEDCEYTWRSVTNAVRDERNPEKLKKYQGTYSPGNGDDELKTLMMIFRAAIEGKVGKAGNEVSEEYRRRRSGQKSNKRESKIWMPPSKSKNVSWA
jgi:hypothetical protein